MSQATINTTVESVEEDPDDPILYNGTTLKKEVVGTHPDDGKRRVKRTHRRVIRDPNNIVGVEPGDTLLRNFDSDSPEQTTIVDVGTDISETGGIHVLLDGEGRDVIHLSMVQVLLERGIAVIYGDRSREYTEVEGLDY